MKDLNTDKEPLATDIIKINQIALEEVKGFRFKKAIGLLHRAEELIMGREGLLELSCITWNNLAMVYKKIGNLNLAMKYFYLCVKNSRGFKDSLSEATVYLNLASIHSELKQVDISTTFVTKALEISDSFTEKNLKAKMTQIIGNSIKASNLQIQSKHWLAVQEFKKTWEQSEDLLGTSHELTKNLKKKFETLVQNDDQNHFKISKSLTKNHLSSKNYRKTPSCRPVRLESLPKIETRKKSSMSFTEKQKTSDFYSDSLYLNKDLLKISRKVKVQSFRKEKIENLNQLIEEVEKNLSNFQRNKEKTAEVSERFQKSSKAASTQVNILKNNENFSLRHRINRANLVKTSENTGYERKNRTSTQLTRVLKESNQSELIPVPIKRKIKLFREKGLGTIFESRSEDFHDVAIFIQTFWRMFHQKKKYLRTKKAAVTIQKNIRKFFVRRIFENILKAVIFIQSVFRGHRVRKLIKYFY
jgi:tetratricopeptide (TPR) repeat protein